MCLDWLDDLDGKDFLKVPKFHGKVLPGLQFFFNLHFLCSNFFFQFFFKFSITNILLNNNSKHIQHLLHSRNIFKHFINHLIITILFIQQNYFYSNIIIIHIWVNQCKKCEKSQSSLWQPATVMVLSSRFWCC